MTIQQRWAVRVCSVVGSAAVLGGVFVFGSFATHRQEGNEMNTTRISVDHVRLETTSRSRTLTKAFEQQLGRFDPDVYKSARCRRGHRGAKAKIEAMVGPSGFMLFGTQDHGALLRLAGQKRKAIQYVVGNPLFALQMTQHDIRASLYAPLRVLIYENEDREDLRGIRQAVLAVRPVRQRAHQSHAAMLDQKLEALVAAAFE
jgi:uncharacterized protein (DUF302 family)